MDRRPLGRLALAKGCAMASSSQPRRWVVTFGVVVLVAALAACGGGEAPELAEPTAPEPEAPEPVEVETPETEPPGDEAPTLPDDAELVWSTTLEERERINAVAASPDGERVVAAAGGTSFATLVSQAGDGLLLDSFMYFHSPDDLAFSPDGSLLAAGVTLGGVLLTGPDGKDPADLADLRTRPDYAGVPLHDGYDNRLAFAPDGAHIATGNRDGEVWIWRLSDGEQVTTLAADDAEYLTGLAYHPSGTLLAATHFDCTVNVWDVDTGAIVHTLELEHPSCYMGTWVTFSPDGELLAAAVYEDWEEFVRIWRVDGFEHLADLDMEVRNFGDLAFSPDSTLLATAAWLMPPTVWDVATGSVRHELDTGIDPEEGEGWYHPTAVAFTPDGGHVVAGYHDGTVELWRLPGAEELVAPERVACEPLPLPGDVLFDTGSPELQPAADGVLTELAAELADSFPDAALTFVGHTDSRGDAAANEQLSLDRAEATRDWFADWAAGNDLDGWTLEVDGRGAVELLVPDTNREGDFLPDAGELNRRVEIVIDAPDCAP
jgi:WD40 repeat protein